MANWGSVDEAANSVLWATTSVNKPANSVNQAALFGNNTIGATVPGMIVGQFGVDTTEMNVSNGSVIQYMVTNPGSGYAANAVVTVTGNATANATANSTGKISAVNVVLPGNSYTTNPTVTIAAPSITFNANTAVNTTLDFISITSNPLQDNESVTYLTNAGNTALVGLTNNYSYFVTGANSTGIKLSSTVGGTAIDLTAKGLTESGHSLVGQTATAVPVINKQKNAGFHSGYVLRKVGTGGRAGRVHYETLVASGSITGDAEDLIFKDA